MDGGGGQTTTPTTTTTQQVLSPQQQRLLDLVMPKAENFINSPISMYPGSTVAGFSPLQLAGQNASVNAAGTIAGQSANANAAQNFLMGPVLFPQSNPALAAATDAAIRPLVSNYNEVIRPGIRSDAIMAGGYGGSRQGVAEGIAAKGLTNKIGDVSATMHSDAYGKGLNAMTSALQMSPALAQLSLMPGTVLDAVGASQRSLEQARLSEDATRYIQQQIMPFLQAQEVAALAYGMPGGSTVTTGQQVTQQQQTSPLQYLMGGLSLAGMFMSDRRGKINITRYGEFQGIPLWSYQYAWGGPYWVGVMADEVAKVRPDCVHRIAGYRVVNYRRLGFMPKLLADQACYIC